MLAGEAGVGRSRLARGGGARRRSRLARAVRPRGARGSRPVPAADRGCWSRAEEASGLTGPDRVQRPARPTRAGLGRLDRRCRRLPVLVGERWSGFSAARWHCRVSARARGPALGGPETLAVVDYLAAPSPPSGCCAWSPPGRPGRRTLRTCSTGCAAAGSAQSSLPSRRELRGHGARLPNRHRGRRCRRPRRRAQRWAPFRSRSCWPGWSRREH